MIYGKRTFCLKLMFVRNFANFSIDFTFPILFLEENSSVQGFALCVVATEEN